MTTILKEIKIDVELLKAIERRAKRENTTEDKIFNEVIENGLEKKESQIPEHLIGNKNTYNPKKNWDNLKNIKKTINGVKPVKTLLDLRTGKG